MKVKKVSVTVRIGRTYDFQTVVYEQSETVELDEIDDRDKLTAEIRDRAFKEVIACTNKAYSKFKEISKS